MYDETLYNLKYLERALEDDGIEPEEEAFMRGFIKDRKTVDKKQQNNEVNL